MANARRFAFQFLVPAAMGIKCMDADAYQQFATGTDDQYLLDLCTDTGSSIRELLEYYLQARHQNKALGLSALEDPLRTQLHKAYQVIFQQNTVENPSEETEIIGKCAFSSSLRDFVLNISGMISSFAGYNAGESAQTGR